MILFEPWTVEELIALAKIPPPLYDVEEVQGRMMELAIEFHVDCQDRRSPRAVVRSLMAARKHARQLSAELNAEKGSVERNLALHITRGDERLHCAIASLRELSSWIDALLQAELKKSTVGTRADKAAQDLINGLGSVWWDHWGKKPGASLTKLKSGKPVFNSPFIRFVRTYLRCLSFEFGDDRLSADPRIRKALDMTPQQIRERIRAPGRKKRRMGK